MWDSCAHQWDSIGYDLKQPEYNQENEQPIRALMPGWLSLPKHQHSDAEDG